MPSHPVWGITSHPHPLHPPHAQTLMDKRVEIRGTTRQDMNGKRGLVTDFHFYEDDPHNNKDRYTVKLDGGLVKVKPANLRAAPVGAGGGGAGSGGKAKGKGVKGRGSRP